jgi:hypothetical protein
MSNCTARRHARKKIGIKAIRIIVIGKRIDVQIAISPVPKCFAVAGVTKRSTARRHVKNKIGIKVIRTLANQPQKLNKSNTRDNIENVLQA